MKNIVKRIASVALAFTLLGTGTAVTRTLSPQSDCAITASAKTKHYYVLKCEKCGNCLSTGIIGRTFMKLHVRNSHGHGWYFTEDVCTAMGCHTADCDNPKNITYYRV